MTTLLLASLANTLIHLSPEHVPSGVALLIVLGVHNLLKVLKSYQDPMRASFAQLARLIAWLVAPAVLVESPGLHFSNVVVLERALLDGPTATPELLCGAFLAFLALLPIIVACVAWIRLVIHPRRSLNYGFLRDPFQGPTAHPPTRADEVRFLAGAAQNTGHRLTISETTLRDLRHKATDSTDTPPENAGLTPRSAGDADEVGEEADAPPIEQKSSLGNSTTDREQPTGLQHYGDDERVSR